MSLGLMNGGLSTQATGSFGMNQGSQGIGQGFQGLPYGYMGGMLGGNNNGGGGFQFADPNKMGGGAANATAPTPSTTTQKPGMMQTPSLDPLNMTAPQPGQ